MNQRLHGSCHWRVLLPAFAEANLQLTGADGVMSAEGMLDDPCLFAGSDAWLDVPTQREVVLTSFP